VAIAWTWTATHQGDMPGFPAPAAPSPCPGSRSTFLMHKIA
jgi:hypothetical protein